MARNFPNSTGSVLFIASDVADLKFVEGDQTWSIHVWAKLAATTDNQTIVSKYPGSGNRGIMFRTTSSGKLGVFWIDGTGSGQEAIGTSTFSTGVWTSVGAHYDPSSNTMTCRFNGVAEGTDTGTIHATYDAWWCIGRRFNASSPLNGDACELAMWNGRILSDAEWLALAKGSSPLEVSSANLVAYWPVWGLGTKEQDIVAGSTHLMDVAGTSVVNHGPVGAPFS